MSKFKNRLVSKKELRTICGIPYTPQHIARLEAAGHFPKRVRLGANRVAWVLSEIDEWIIQRLNTRDTSIDLNASF